jgi:diadenosine tetraphosphate (Ap4A) HIT family hydrolase
MEATPMKPDPRLEADSTFVTDLDLCQVRLSHNAAFPWILLIPKRDNVKEIIDLPNSDQQFLIQEIALASKVMQQLFSPFKLNVASLGNVVPQLHVHIIARYQTDKAWPGPVWNSGVSEGYDPEEKHYRINQMKENFNKILVI